MNYYSLTIAVDFSVTLSHVSAGIVHNVGSYTCITTYNMAARYVRAM